MNALKNATTFVSDKVTAPLKNVVMWSAIAAGVFFLIAILLFITLLTKGQRGVFANIIVAIALVIFLAQGVVATMFAVYVSSVVNKIDNGFTKAVRGAVVALAGGKLINALVGRKTVDEKTGEPLVDETAPTQTDQPPVSDQNKVDETEPAQTDQPPVNDQNKP